MFSYCISESLKQWHVLCLFILWAAIVFPIFKVRSCYIFRNTHGVKKRVMWTSDFDRHRINDCRWKYGKSFQTVGLKWSFFSFDHGQNSIKILIKCDNLSASHPKLYYNKCIKIQILIGCAITFWTFWISFFISSLSSHLNGISAMAESLGDYCCANNPFKMNSVNLLSHRGEL